MLRGNIAKGMFFCYNYSSFILRYMRNMDISQDGRNGAPEEMHSVTGDQDSPSGSPTDSASAPIKSLPGYDSLPSVGEKAAGDDDPAAMSSRIMGLTKENESLKKEIRRISLQNKKLDEQVFDLFTISQTSKVFVAHHDLSLLSEIFVSVVAERINVKKSCLLLQDDSGVYRAWYSVGLEESDMKQVHYEKKEGLFWRLIANGDPFSVLDIEGGLRFSQIFRESNLSVLESSYWVPLKAKENVVGILTIDTREIGEEELNFLALLSAQAAMAFQGAFLYKKLEAATTTMEKQMHNLSILYDVGKALNFIDDLTKLLVLILDRGIDIAESQKGSLMLFDEKTDELVVRVVRGIDKETEDKILTGEIQCTRIKKGEGVAGRVFESGEPIIINKIKDDPRFKESKDSRVDNILCVPLKVYDECIGVINITNKQGGGFFSKDDLSIVTALANQAAVAINNARLYELAVTDSITKLLIRRHFMQRLDDEIRRSKRYSHKLSLVMVDIDKFKEINDTFGHQAGDTVLSEASKIFKKSVRSTDIVGRYGGDEFCFALPETGLDGAKVFCERLRLKLESTQLSFESFLLKKTLSLGISTFPDDAEDLTELIKCADLALYKAKRDGRNRTYSYCDISGDELTALRDYAELRTRE